MNDVPHQWVLDHLSALCLMGEMDKEEVERIYALFVQRFPDEVAAMKQKLAIYERYTKPIQQISKLMDLEQQGDNYITESANEN